MPALAPTQPSTSTEANAAAIARTQWIFLALMLLCVRNLLEVFFFSLRPRLDFRIYYHAGQLFDAGLSPYRGDDQIGLAYVYPQAFAFIMALLSRLDLPSAILVWDTISLLSLVFIARAALRWATQTASQPATAMPEGAFWRWTLLALAIGFTPALYGWRNGQVDLVLTALVAGVFVLPQRAMPWGAGILLALGTILKFSPVLLLPVLMLAFGWRFLISYCVTIAAYVAVLASQGILGEELFFIMVRVPELKFDTYFPAISLASLFAQVLFENAYVDESGYYGGWQTQLLTGLVLAGYAAGGLWLWWRRGGFLALLTIGVAASFLASPFLEPHHLTLALPFLCAWTIFYAAERRLGEFTLCLAMWVLGGIYIHFHEFALLLPTYSLLLYSPALAVLALRAPDAFGSSPWLWLRDPVQRVWGRWRAR